MNVAGIHHITLRSQDPVAARRFYEEVVGLGFMEIPVSGEVTSMWKGAPTEGVLLATQVGNTFLVIQPPLEGTGGGDRFSEYRIGLDHLALAVEDRACRGYPTRVTMIRRWLRPPSPPLPRSRTSCRTSRCDGPP